MKNENMIKTLQVNNMDNAIIIMNQMRKDKIKVIRHYIGVVYQ